MSPLNSQRLVKLADREFRQFAGKPVTPAPSRRFKAVNINPSKYDAAWDRKRGAAVRLTAVLLREDDAGLERRVCESDATVKTYTEAAVWLQRESAYLRKVARLLDLAGGRLAITLSRYAKNSVPPAS
ncbi:MAG TPA: hypothetical protein VJQ47_13885 [Steroidobacteraceae bacterium]|nr:hypothetical protein [Steroidobacteraceae bacterium]